MADSGPAEDGRYREGKEDRRKIYLAKAIRSVAYGLLSAALVLYLNQDLGFSTLSSLVVTSLTLVGAALTNLVAVGPLERRIGTRRAFAVFSALFTVSALLLFLTANPFVVIAAVLIGGVGATTADNGPLASLDQAVIPSTTRRRGRPMAFAWYNLIANFAAAAGALLLVVPNALAPTSLPILPAAPHPWILLIYLALAGSTWAAYAQLSPLVERPAEPGRGEGSAPLTTETRRNTSALAVLFGVDAFAGGLVINPLLAAYFVLAWHQSASNVGLILFAAGTVSGLSFLVASRLASKVGLLNTMVGTHIPSNVLLVLVPFMPTLSLALGVLLARFALSQMDVPTRQAFTMNLVTRRERAEVAARLAGSRSVAQSVGPFPGSALEAAGYLALPFVIAGTMKIAYDAAIYMRFRRVPDEVS